jgi:GcrA cell cycle regulator
MLQSTATYGDIARTLGVSRNVVAGMVYRLRKNERINRPLPVRNNRLKKPPVEKKKPVVKTGISFMELQPNSCRYSTGKNDLGYVFCAQVSVTGKPYCEPHCKMVYVPGRPDSKKDNRPFKLNY